MNVSLEEGAMYWTYYSGYGMLEKTFMPKPQLVNALDTVYSTYRHHTLALIPELRTNTNPEKIWAKILQWIAVGKEEIEGFTQVNGDIEEVIGRPGHGEEHRLEPQDGSFVYKERRSVLCPMAYMDVMYSLNHLLQGVLQDAEWADITRAITFSFARCELEKLGEPTAEDFITSPIMDRIQSFTRLCELLDHAQLYVRALLTSEWGKEAVTHMSDKVLIPGEVTTKKGKKKKGKVWSDKMILNLDPTQKDENEKVYDWDKKIWHDATKDVPDIDIVDTAIIALAHLEQELQVFLSAIESEFYALRGGGGLTADQFAEIDLFMKRLITLEAILSVIPEIHELTWLPKFEFFTVQPSGGFRTFNIWPHYHQLYYTVDQPGELGWTEFEGKPLHKLQKDSSKTNVWRELRRLYYIKGWPIIMIYPLAVTKAKKEAEVPVYTTAENSQMMLERYNYRLITPSAYNKLLQVRATLSPRTLRLYPSFKGLESDYKNRKYLIMSAVALGGVLECEGFHPELLVDIAEKSEFFISGGTCIIPKHLSAYPAMDAPDKYDKISTQLYVTFGTNIHLTLRGYEGRIATYSLMWKVD